MNKKEQAMIDAAASDTAIMRKIRERYSPEELRAIASGGRATSSRRTKVDFSGTSFRFGLLSDTHIGSKADRPEWIGQAFEEFDREKCDFLIHAGDLTDGMGGGKLGYVNDLRVIGVDAQKMEAVKIFKAWTKPGYIVAGNHDLWAYKAEGVDVVQSFCDTLTNFKPLGHTLGTLDIGGAKIQVFHGEDAGNSYAITYRIQQIIRAMVGGYKPHVLVTGHDHKMFYLTYRMIHGIGAGSCAARSRWQEAKRLENHAGFSIVTVWVNRSGVARVSPVFYPFYA
jgi:putative phosphoesterase